MCEDIYGLEGTPGEVTALKEPANRIDSSIFIVLASCNEVAFITEKFQMVEILKVYQKSHKNLSREPQKNNQQAVNTRLTLHSVLGGEKKSMFEILFSS